MITNQLRLTSKQILTDIQYYLKKDYNGISRSIIEAFTTRIICPGDIRDISNMLIHEHLYIASITDSLFVVLKNNPYPKTDKQEEFQFDIKTPIIIEEFNPANIALLRSSLWTCCEDLEDHLYAAFCLQPINTFQDLERVNYMIIKLTNTMSHIAQDLLVTSSSLED